MPTFKIVYRSTGKEILTKLCAKHTGEGILVIGYNSNEIRPFPSGDDIILRKIVKFLCVTLYYLTNENDVYIQEWITSLLHFQP